MSRAEKELEQYGKRILAPLRQADPINPQKAEQIKKQFLLQGESLRQALAAQPHAEPYKGSRQRSVSPWFARPGLLMKALLAVLVAVVIILAGSSITVLAAQDSLPGDQLYPVKTWSENLRYALTSSPQARLNLTLEYTNTRMGEISSLVARGTSINEQTTAQYQQELNNALELAVQMDDSQLQTAMQNIMNQASRQEMVVQGLIDRLPAQAPPAMLRLQERLTAQIQLSALGEADPKTFRMELQERLHRQQGPDTSPGSGQPEINPQAPEGTPMPDENGGGGGDGNKSGQPTEMPGNGNPGNGLGQPNPGNSNHQANPQHTANP
jgi:hypothetical protein